MIDLSPAERRSLRARAHALNPVVSIGAQGLTPAVAKEIHVALNAHGLIKIRVHDEDRTAREELLARVCDELGAAPVQHLGKLLIIYRPKPEPAAPERRRSAPTSQRKVSGKTARKPSQALAGRQGTSSARRSIAASAGGKNTARAGVSRALGAAGSDETMPRATPALAPEAPRRRRRVVVMASTHSTGARNAPTVRRRRKNP